MGPRAASPWMKSEAAGQSQGGGREAHSRPSPSLPSLSLPFLLLLQGELEVTTHRHPRPARRHPNPRAGSVSLASRRPILNPRGLLAAHLARLPPLAAGLFVEPSQAALASVFLFRQTNKSRFGYHGRAVRRPTQTEAARLASLDAPGSAQALPGHLPRSHSGLVTLSSVTHVPQPPSQRPCDMGPGTPRLQQKTGTWRSPGPAWAGAFL